MDFYNRSLDHINLTVPDIESAVDFYTNTMGFKVTERFKTDMEFVFISDGNTTYELTENRTFTTTVIDHIAYSSENIEADFKYFSNLGITTTELGYVDFLFENGVNYFFIKGAGNDKIEFIQKKSL